MTSSESRSNLNERKKALAKTVYERESNGSNKRLQREPALLITLLLLTTASIGAWFYAEHYHDRARPTREMSLTHNEPTVAADRSGSIVNHVELRKQALAADAELLKKLSERKSQFRAEPQSNLDRKQYVSTYFEETEQALEQIGPESADLAAPLLERLQDEDAVKHHF